MCRRSHCSLLLTLASDYNLLIRYEYLLLDKRIYDNLPAGANVTTVTISMPESLKQFLDREVETKGYGNVSEYVRGLLRQAQAKDADARLEGLLLEGLASGEDIPLTPAFWQELKRDAEQILAKHRKTRRTRAAK